MTRILPLFLLWSIHLFATDTLTAPGSHTVYVSFYNNEIVELKCRNCQHDPEAQCKCCDNFVDGQPVIQGCARIFANLCERLFDVHASNDGQQVIRYLRVENFLKRLESTGYQNYFHIVKNGEIISTEDYSHLIRAGKIPVTDFNPHHADQMQFHNMIHDVNNHISFWLFLPDVFRNYAIERYRFVFEVLENMKQEATDDALKALIDVLVYWCARRIDTSMGTLNNILFTQHHIGIDFHNPEIHAQLGPQLSILFNLVDARVDDKPSINLRNHTWLKSVLPAVATAIVNDPIFQKEVKGDESFLNFMRLPESKRFMVENDFAEMLEDILPLSDSEIALIDVGSFVDKFQNEISVRTNSIKKRVNLVKKVLNNAPISNQKKVYLYHGYHI